MKKLITLVLAALMLLSFASCSSNKKSNSQTDENVTPAEIEAAIAKALDDGYLCTVDVPEDSIFSSAIGRLDLNKVISYVAKQTTVPSVNMDSVVIAKCQPGYADEAVTLFNEYFAQTIGYVRQYPFGVAKAENARIYKVGDTVMFIMAGASASEDATAEDAAKLAADEYKKIDEAIKSIFGSVPENLAVVPENSGNNGGGLIGG
ncbi:MAG: hypothetical protein IJL87_04260 [Clostridia bacterium]|nr:hypothetical protein [Clostridia bacterium]